MDITRCIEGLCYGVPDAKGQLVNQLTGEPIEEVAQFVHSQFRHMVLSPQFSCVGAKSAVKSNMYRFTLYKEMGTPETTADLARDLALFVKDQESLGSINTFIACFDKPYPTSEQHFEDMMWHQLQHLHDEDLIPWDQCVSQDPNDPHFSYSFFGRAFFVVGMHPAASRYARRFAYPCLVFNAHHMFQHLRDAGKFDSFQKAIRRKEFSLQKGLNPNLTDFGDASDARQYSGVHHPGDWQPPFQAKDKDKEETPE
ncbi:guanitoxin biosynthesis heme-dependent pre-guanitoxin N-hydroxylase GntA [Acanthopleuribacter pedis]|uniref:YqcI/YcgG family protein n=1 Tax=Acanthopleuribacter pedis TaxID=442870 RepID=A0A8J7Q5V7_9BACT|nr:guanitoxin biosynthesis heme-dependent pre-guanitoxin N-hydroxylase GntA [Acanthopleuribacter pedis]MBO1321037.1 YqcI/YcgG family protein [Acanthopleuribacter pedis]